MQKTTKPMNATSMPAHAGRGLFAAIKALLSVMKDLELWRLFVVFVSGLTTLIGMVLLYDTTDLVFREPVDVSAAAQRGIEGFVLTEWKVADEENAATRFEDARQQAQLYQQGPLVGTEVTGYRYAIAVSLADLPKGAVPGDMEIGGVVYRHINIAIEPRKTSAQVRAKSYLPGGRGSPPFSD
jgi:hypothetical protein